MPTRRGRVRALSQIRRAAILASVQLPDAFSLAGRVALTGGSPGGIGFAVARLLGDLGASVAVAATTDRAHAPPPISPRSASQRWRRRRPD